VPEEKLASTPELLKSQENVTISVVELEEGIKPESSYD
jgi:hypothetical protein